MLDDAESECDASWPALIQGLREGNPRILSEFCVQYGDPLFRLADKHLAGGLRRRVGPEDVVQSACRTFLRRVHGGEFQLSDRDGLWGILAITLTKIREQTRFHLRRKRGIDREAAMDGPSQGGIGWGIADSEPAPDEAVAFADQFQQVLSGLDEEERQLVDLKLQNYTNEEAAGLMACSERTVRRILKRVQRRLSQTLDRLSS